MMDFHEHEHEQEWPEYWQETAASEVARVFFGNPYLLEALGGLLPAVIDMQRVERVLDIGCGNGEWARRMAKAYPRVDITGIDTSLQLIQEAVRRARQERLQTLSFYQFGSAQSLQFASESFDVVHCHSLSSFVATAMWSRILAEKIRLVKVGGWLTIADYEHGTTSSTAFNRLAAMGMAGVRALGGSISPSSPTMGVAARLYGFLVDAGLVDVAYTVHAVDFGVNSHEQTRTFLEDFIASIIKFKPFVLQQGLTDDATFDALLAQSREDFFQPDFCGYAYLVSAYGRKES